uniref:Uncharacterized protein n=1 Tax=Vespula pensylvanica TaxID=30213 RepID=A0A834JPW9_VESPE|nr:hypothetical protein H0235_017091 [Vespula pensylvanica]
MISTSTRLVRSFGKFLCEKKKKREKRKKRKEKRKQKNKTAKYQSRGDSSSMKDCTGDLMDGSDVPW